ncbi:MAG: AraC family transcriptional regulator [Oenococcus sp.]|uniref:helix-turn-helix transcriptional regulator n=1 Tax=Oenococcus sp. TaxID=1979414 RepID=UPI0039ED1437
MNKLTNTLKDFTKHGDPLTPLAIYDQNYPHGGLNVPYHWHDEWEWIWVQQGDLSFTIDEKKLIVHENDMVLINSRVLHEIRSIKNTPSLHHAIVFSPEILKSSYEDQMMVELIKPFLTGKIVLNTLLPADRNAKYRALMQDIITAHATGQKDWYFQSKILILELLNLFFSDHLYQTRQEKDHVDLNEHFFQAVSYIHENYATKITIPELSQITGLSSEYFIRKFKKTYDQTPLTYINNFRLYKASQMLAETHNDITEICFACGFNSVSYFIKLFKHEKNMSPGKYRKLALSNKKRATEKRSSSDLKK